jgi:hypothetical protein
MPQSNIFTRLSSNRFFILILISVCIGLFRQFAMFFLGVRRIPLPPPLGSIYPMFNLLWLWWFMVAGASGLLIFMIMSGRIENTHNRIIYPFIYLMFLLLYVEF